MKDEDEGQLLYIAFKLKAKVKNIEIGWETFDEAIVNTKFIDYFVIEKRANIRKTVIDTMIARGINVIDVEITNIKGE